MRYRPLLYALSVTVPWVVWICGCLNYYRYYLSSSFEPTDENVFDFIVVGSGAGGAVVARRLATNPNVKVLLLEAGGDPSLLNHIPGLALELTGYPETDWMHLTVPQKHACWGLQNNQSNWNAGKVLGGSTTLNFMFYLRGHPLDYDNWASITGDKEWSYENVLPHFKKSIKSYKGGFGDNEKHYGENEYGFLNIEGRPWTPLNDQLIEAGKETGFSSHDVNGGKQRSGVGIIETNQKNGWRYGTYSAIITDLEKRPNVKISRFSEVTKIKFDKNLRAEGVWYMQFGVKKFARATKEVILSAGSVNSPRILMTSGVGPTAHLKSVGIKSKVNLPVGQNLHDHLLTPMFPFIIDEPISFNPDRDFSLGELARYLTKGTGALATPNALHSQFFYSSAKVKKSVDWPDFQAFFAPAGIFKIFSESFSRGTRIPKENLDAVLEPAVGTDGFILLAGLVRPKSRGDVKLQSKNPLVRPLIDPHYLEHPDDIAAIVDGMKQLIKIFETSTPFKKLNARLRPKNIPGCEGHKFKSDAYFECYARHWTLTIWHPVGTCKMGRQNDKTAVVDSKLRVFGTKSLRVVDASIMPDIVNANTMAPTFMIGEKGSDFIREFWANQFLVSDLKDFLFSIKKNKKCFYSQLI